MIGARRVILLTVCLVGSIGCRTPLLDGSPYGFDAAVDGAQVVDAVVDGAAVDSSVPIARYDIAYINDITIDPGVSGMFAFLLVVNTGTAPLNLSTALVVSFSDDANNVDWTFTKPGDSTLILKPGHAAGCLSPTAMEDLVTGGIVTEPIDGDCPDIFQGLGLNFAMNFSTNPLPLVTFHAQAMLRIDGVDIVLPFTVHVDDSNNATLVFNSTKRISTQP
jgi:hypothetical protein